MSLVTPRKGYKSVPWLFGKEIEIPEEWEMKRLDEIGEIIGGGTPDSTNNDYWDGEILWAVPTDITKLQINQIENTERKITQQGLDNSSAKMLPEESILITSRATVGECAITTKPISTNQGFQNIICNDKHHNYLIFYLIKQFPNNLLRLSHGTTFLEISKNQIKKVTLPVSNSFQEQQKITSILSNVDNLIDSTVQVIAHSKKVKTGLMQKLLTRGIGHVKFKKVPWLFGKEIEIPEDWEVKKLENIGEIIGGGTPDSTNNDYWNGDILWAVPTDITKLNINQIEDTERKITKLGLENSSAKLLPKETILITTRATIGECAITTKPITTNQGFQNIVCNDNYDNYLIFYLIKQFPNNLLRLSQGTTFLEINKNQMKKVVIPISNSLPEQQKIASILSNVDAQIDSQTQYKEKLEKLKKSLMQKLLTGEVRV